MQRAYAEGPPAHLEIDEQAVIDLGTDSTRARIVMPFIDVARGVPEALLRGQLGRQPVSRR